MMAKRSKTTPQPKSRYNATIRWYKGAALMCTAAAQVDAEGRILRVAGISCAPGEGTPAFDVYYREMAIWKRLGADRIDVALDGADGLTGSVAFFRAKVLHACDPERYPAPKCPTGNVLTAVSFRLRVALRCLAQESAVIVQYGDDLPDLYLVRDPDGHPALSIRLPPSSSGLAP